MKIKVLVIPPNVWSNLNTLSEIPVGTSIEIQNQGSTVELQEGLQPSISDSGVPLTGMGGYYAIAGVKEGSDIIWAKPEGDYSCKLTIGEV